MSYEVVLIVGAGTPIGIRDVFAADVRNFRQGRRDGFRAIMARILADVSEAERLLGLLYVVPLDLDADGESGSQFALEGLRQVLVQPTTAEQAWAILTRHALRLSRRGRWDREGIRELLRSNGFALRPVGPDAAWLEQIAYARTLNKRWRPRTAAGVLDDLTAELRNLTVHADVRRQLHTVRGASALMLEDLGRAREEFSHALDYVSGQLQDPTLSPEDRQAVAESQYRFGTILHLGGDDGEASRIARAILAVDPRNVRAWGLLVRAGSSEDATPPEGVADTAEYRDALGEIAGRNGDWPEVVRVLARSVAESDESPARLNAYGQALLNVAAEMPDNADKVRILEQVERVANEAAGILEGAELDGQFARALFMRARSREMLGRGNEARQDYDRAASLDPTEPNTVIRLVGLRADGGDPVGAMALLPDSVVGESAILRVLRADLRATNGTPADAASDLESVLAEHTAPATRGSIEIYMHVARIALAIERNDLADVALGAVTAGGLGEEGSEAGVLRARLAIAMDDWPLAIAEYRAAAARGGAEDGPAIIGELATQFALASRYEEAVAAFEEAGATTPTSNGFRNYVASLMRAGHFARVATLAERLERDAAAAGTGISSLPGVLLDAAIEVASRREDAAGVARLLEVRIAQECATQGVAPSRLLLPAARAHAVSGNAVRAKALVDEVAVRNGLEPRERIEAAKTLVALGDHPRALGLAFMAVRTSPNESEVVSDFIQVVLSRAVRGIPETSRGDGELDEWMVSAPAGVNGVSDDDDDGDVGTDGHSGTVRADTFVRVYTADRQKREYFIYAEMPVDSSRDEFLVGDQAVADLVGKSVGEVVVRNAGRWDETRLRIARVLPAMVVVFRRHMRTFSARFPGDSPYQMFRLDNPLTPQGLGPILAGARAAANHLDEVVRMYDETVVPLGTVARTLGRRLGDLARWLAGDPARRIHTDRPPITDYAHALNAASTAGAVVLTRPALIFLDLLGLWPALASRYRVIVPAAMLDEWDEELRDLADTNTRGRLTLREVGARPAIDTIPAGSLDAALQAGTALREDVTRVASIMHRPASALSSRDDEWRRLIGAASFDAVTLAESEGAVLYADDLGLRAIAIGRSGTRSFSTSILLDVLRSDNRITMPQFEEAIVRLIEWGHDIVPIRAATIVAAFGVAATSMRTSERVLERLADQRVACMSAAIVGAGALRLMATAPIVSTPLEIASEAVAGALIRNREPAEVAPIFLALLRQQFRLIPRDLGRVEAAFQRALEHRRIL